MSYTYTLNLCIIFKSYAHIYDNKNPNLNFRKPKKEKNNPLKQMLCVATLTWPSVGVKPNTWKSWGFGVLWDSRMFRARQQGANTPRIGVFLVSLERS
jgi:hypothetical protein